MVQNNKISIILPVFNGEKYLRDSIDSIINQTYTNWELIIVNDCSTDSTISIIQEYIKKVPNIKLINNATNLKLPRSLNIGFENASGKYLTWTSDDNYYKPEALHVMANTLDNEKNIDLVYSDMFIINGNKKIKSTNLPKPEYIWNYNIIKACFLYRKTLAETVGNYNPDMFLLEDYDFWIRCHKYGKFKKIDLPLYYYRIHNDSLSNTKYKQVCKQYYKAIEEHKTYLYSLCKNRKEKIEFYANFYRVVHNEEKLKQNIICDAKSKIWFFLPSLYWLLLKRKIKIANTSIISKFKKHS